MLNKNKLVRNIVYILFCLLILIVGTALTYYISVFDESNFESISEVVENNYELNSSDLNCDEDDESGYIFGSLFYKFSAAFFAGSFLSDKVFLKLGVI